MALLMLLCTGCSQSADGDSAENSGKVMILFTGDFHCAVDEGFGFAGLQAIRNKLEADGYETILVDNGDAIQGAALGMMTKGEAIIDLMNSMKYDIATPGNHDFDYTVNRFLELTEKADFPYISCNFEKEGELVLDPYVIKEAGGMRIAFVGVTTPESLTKSTPAYFSDENGKLVYGFKQGGDGQELYQAVQDAVDSARAEGADYVYVMGHVGMGASSSVWTFADIIEITTGIDVFLDGHSHDLDEVVMKNKDGDDVLRISSGTKLQAIGYSELSKEDGILDTDIWSWNNDKNAQELFGLDCSISKEIKEAMDDLNQSLQKEIGTNGVELTIYDPVEKYDNGSPVRMVRRAETNLGDFCADAARVVMETDIGLVNGGAIRTDLPKGDLTYGDLLKVSPFNNEIIKMEVTGQQILDALEWGARMIPNECGGFLQVSGLTYEIDVNIPSPCKSDTTGMYTGIKGDRRVRNVKVGGNAIDPKAYYTIAGNDYLLQNHGDGYTMFDNVKNIIKLGKLDNEVLIEYISDYLDSIIGLEYEDPYGDGRITIIE